LLFFAIDLLHLVGGRVSAFIAIAMLAFCKAIVVLPK
jgi:hypothetical protein